MLTGRRVVLGGERGFVVSEGTLIVGVSGVEYRFSPHSPVRIGRERHAQVPLAHPEVSRDHLVVEPSSDGWSARDVGSSGGTFLAGRRVNEFALLPAPAVLSIRLGGPDGVNVTLGVTSVSDHRPKAARLLIGRSDEADIQLNDVLASRRHAEIRWSAAGVTVHDLDSANGTFVNGHRTSEALLAVDDQVGIGSTSLVWNGDKLVHQPSRTDGEALVARHLTVTTRSGKVLLKDVSVSVPERGLVAVIGPSGAGKSTLLDALTGNRPAATGTVSWRGQDLYANYDDLRSRIGLVPQDDTLHPQLTVGRALAFAAELRFSPDTAAAERRERIEAVLGDVNLMPQRDQRIDSLSGGQRKRVSIAVELLTAPPLLFLDEPTSGLDPGLDQQVMTTLRTLADGGRVVAVVTHSVLSLDLCDRVLLLAPGGRTAFYGPPDKLLTFFEAPNYAAVFAKLDEPGWHTRFVASSLHRQFVGDSRIIALPPRDAPPPPRSPAPFKQAVTLTRRHLALVAADRLLLVMLVAMPLVLALLARAVPGDNGLFVEPLGTSSAALGAIDAQQRLVVLILGGVLMGAALSVRELVKERSVYRRERAVGLSPTAYLLSKSVVLWLLVALASIVFTMLALLGADGPREPLLLPGKLEVAVAIAACACASATAGLAISAWSKSADQTMPALVGFVMAQLVLSGGLIPVAGRVVLEQVALLSPSRFAYAAVASTVEAPLPRGKADPLLVHQLDHWWLMLGGLIVQTALLLVVTGLLLARSVSRRAPG